MDSEVSSTASSLPRTNCEAQAAAELAQQHLVAQVQLSRHALPPALVVRGANVGPLFRVVRPHEQAVAKALLPSTVTPTAPFFNSLN